MRKFVNILKFKIAPILFSVILLLFLPLYSLNVHATTIALPSNLGVGFDLYSIFRLFNMSEGLSTPSLDELPNKDELIENGFTEDQYNSLVETHTQMLNDFSPSLGDRIQSLIRAALNHGKLIIPLEVYALYKNFIADRFGSEVGTEAVLSSIPGDVSIYPAQVISFDVTGSKASDSSQFVTYRYTFTFPSDFVVFKCDHVTSFEGSNSQAYYFFNVDPSAPVPSFSSTKISSSINGLGQPWYPFRGSTLNLYSPTVTLAGGYLGLSMYHYYKFYDMTSEPFVLPFNCIPYSDSHDFPSLLAGIRSGSLSSSSDISGSLVSVDDDVISSTNTIESDGSVAGDTSITLPDFSVLNDILNNLRDSSISYQEAIESLGLALTPSASSVDEKSSLLDILLSEAGSQAIQESTSELSNSFDLIESAEDSFRPYYDPESENQDYVPNWFLELPDLENPENDDSDENHLVEIVHAIPVVTGLLTELFDSSGPFKLLFYVGITFVMFSVLVGMAHFIGSYGDRKVLSSSPKALIGSSNVPLITRKKG